MSRRSMRRRQPTESEGSESSSEEKSGAPRRPAPMTIGGHRAPRASSSSTAAPSIDEMKQWSGARPGRGSRSGIVLGGSRAAREEEQAPETEMEEGKDGQLVVLSPTSSPRSRDEGKDGPESESGESEDAEPVLVAPTSASTSTSSSSTGSREDGKDGRSASEHEAPESEAEEEHGADDQKDVVSAESEEAEWEREDEKD